MSDTASVKRILVLAANPKGTSRLQLDTEVRDIEAGLQRSKNREQFVLTQIWAVRPRDIRRAMLDISPQIVHFSGYGSGDEGLVFEDESGRPKLVEGQALAQLFELFSDKVECVVLNGCYSEVQAQSIARYIKSVIGMTQAIGDEAAIEFSVGFYDALGAGRSVDFAYKLGCNAIAMAGIPEHLTPILLEQSTNGDAIIQPESESSQYDSSYRLPIEEMKSVVDPFKTYDNVDEIILLYDEKFQVEEVDRFKDTKRKSAFELYRATKKTLKGTDSYYFLHLLGGITIKNTFDKFVERHPGLERDNLIILLPKEKGQVDPQKRLKNVSDIFSPINTFYISDFIWEQCTNQDFKDELEPYEISGFVDPHIKTKTSNQITAIEYITRWIDRDNSSILLITGSGGIGKTTITKRAANEFIQIRGKKVLFIDANTIISHINESIESLDGLCDVYTFYIAYCESQGYEMDDSKFLSQDLFRANLDNGNIAIILDGLDEVISRFGNIFDVDYFFNSIDDYCGSARLGKVIISCRNQFLEGREFEKIEVIEILPFDIALTKQYFSNIFPNYPKRIDKGVSLASQLTKDKDEYIPFILDVVVFILEDKIDNEGQFSDPSFDSKILTEKIENDYIIYKICNREEKRYSTSLTTDQQIKFFVSLASEYDGCIRVGKILELLRSLLGVEDTIYIDALIAHPILIKHGDIIAFRYDFFREHFKGILISSLLVGEERIDSEIIRILGDKSRFNSSFIKICCDRLNEEYKGDEFNLLIISLIEEIRGFNEKKTVSLHEKNKAISGAFLIALHRLSSRTKESHTELLKDIFSVNNEISGFHFYGINEKILFDFSGLRFTNSFISEYAYFWECTFNDKTYFKNSEFSFLNLRSGVKTLASRRNFDLDTCRIDKTIDKVLFNKNNEEKSRQASLADDISHFLKLFYSEGRMKPQKESALKGKYRGKNDYNNLTKLLRRHLFIEEYRSHKVKKMKSELTVCKKYESEAVKFCLEGTMSPKIKQIISD